jgi:tRNA(Ile)-lysidine synthase
MFKPIQLLPLFKNLAKTQLWLGYSGGLDSQVLLHALVELINTQQLDISLSNLHAVHINHGWSKHAQHWEQHCQQECQRLKVDYHAVTINAKPSNGESPEAYARTARYAALAKFIHQNDYLLTAHQQDDQAETLLLQLLRGAGIKGLASMPQLSAFAQGWHFRPLLNIARADLLAYAKHHQLNWIEDESNNNTRYTRNFLRQQILPELKQRWPTVNAAIARSANHCAEASLLLDELAQQDLKQVQGDYPNSLSCSRLLALPAIRQKNILRFWFDQLNIHYPSTAQLKHILQDILHSKQDANPEVILQNKIIKRYRNNLFIIDRNNSHDATAIYTWDLTQPLVIPALGSLTATLTFNKGIRADILKQGKLSIRFRQLGERCHPAGRQGSHPLKKLFQEWRVPPWQRDHIPLLYCDDQLVAVIGYCICADFAAGVNEAGFIVDLR